MRDDDGGGGTPPADKVEVDTDSLEEFGKAAEKESKEYGTRIAGNRIAASPQVGTTLPFTDLVPTWGTGFEESKYVRRLHDRQLQLARTLATNTHGGLKAFAYGTRLIARSYRDTDSYNAITFTKVDTALPDVVPQPYTGSANAAEERQRRETVAPAPTGSTTAADERNRRKDDERPADPSGPGYRPSHHSTSPASEYRQEHHATPDDLDRARDDDSSSDRKHEPGSFRPHLPTP